MIFNLLLEGEKQQTSWTSYLVMGLLIVAIIGLFVWTSVSNKKKQKEAQNMVSALKVGDRVKTIGGICGYVAEINDGGNTFVLETGTDANKSFIKLDKGAIYQSQSFLDYANGKSDNFTSTIDDGLRAQMIIDAVVRSNEEKRYVKIEEIEKELK